MNSCSAAFFTASVCLIVVACSNVPALCAVAAEPTGVTPIEAGGPAITAQSLAGSELPESPLRFIEKLKTAGERFTVARQRLDYVRESVVPPLIELLDSKEPCAFVDLSESSIYYPGKSTVGREAAYLIEGFRSRYYPHRLTSQHFNPDLQSIRLWYHTWNHLRRLHAQEQSTEASGHTSAAVPKAQASPRFAIYLVKKPHHDMDELELDSQPVLTEQHIVRYDWPTHTLLLTEQGRSRIPDVKTVGVAGKEFVIVADGQRCYRGAFWTFLSSMSYDRPIIDVTPLGEGVRIQRAYPSEEVATGKDPRPDERIRQVLESLGKLSEPEVRR